MSWLSGLGGILTGGLSTVIDAIVQGNSDSGLDGQGHWDWLTGQNGIVSGSPGDAMFGENGIFSNPEGAWDTFTNGQTNAVNAQIAKDNLQYQKERNEIEDARYEEETAYNREFAEEERDYQRKFAEEEREYQRALQERLFNREDTALERQASSLSSMGINPLSQQLNGLNAGQSVGASTSGTASAPGASGRGGQALKNDMKYQGTGVLSALAPFMSFAQTINAVETGSLQRDLLQSQVEHQNLNNFIYAKENGVLPYKYKDFNYLNGQDVGQGIFDRINTRNKLENNMLTLDYKKKYMPDFARNLDYVLSPDFMQTAERALTKGSELYNKAFDSLEGELFNELGKKGKSWNPFQLLKSIFY